MKSPKPFIYTYKRYTEREIQKIADIHGLELTDCHEDKYPHITIAEPDGDPLFQFNWVNDSQLVLSWTDWD